MKTYRPITAALVALFVIGLLSGPSATHATASTTTTFSGQATVVNGQLAGLMVGPLVDTGPVSPSGGRLEASLLDYPISGVPDPTGGALRAEVLGATVVAQGNKSSAEALVASLSLAAAGQTVGAEFLAARASATCNGSTATISGSSEVVGLTINGQTIAVTGNANQTVPVSTFGAVVINEQIASASAANGDITVNALHIMLTDPVLRTKTDLIVASAHADIACAITSGCANQGFVTGGGWITGPSGAKANFAVAGGPGNWGHLLYIDHGSGFRVKGTGVTAYAATGLTSRQINGTAQWTGVFGSNVTAEAIAAKAGETITVFPYQNSPLTGGAPHFSQADQLYYNGATFDGFVDRPRRQFNTAVSYFAPLFGRSHNLKVGYDWQSIRSGAQFIYQNNQLFIDKSFNAANHTFEPDQRRDYDSPQSSTSRGKLQALYVRDKFDISNRIFLEAGLRYEKEKGHSDIGEATVDASNLSPRLSASYDLRGDGKSIVIGTAGRFYQFITQGFSDNFAQVPQQQNYTNFVWDGSKYVQSGRITAGASSFRPNTNLNPTYTDEVTAGFQQQFGNTIGVGVRGIWRKWGDLIDDIRGFNADGSTFRRVVNYSPARHQYKAVELTFEKRFSRHWNANANYTWSRATGNHFSDTFSGLGDWIDAQCRTTADPAVGNNGVIPCLEVQNGANKSGRLPFDRPHNLKASGAYTFNLGPVALTAGMTGEYISGIPFTQSRAVNVLKPGTTTNAGPTAVYFYEPR